MLLENEGEILAMTEMETYSGQSPIVIDNDDKVISLDISALSGQLSGDFADKETVDHLTACCEEVSGAISSLSADKQDKLVFGYDSDDSISSINGSAVGQNGIPASAQETIDLVQSNSGTWNSASEIPVIENSIWSIFSSVNPNSANWNEVSSKLDISAFSSVSGDFATTGDLQNYATTSYVNNINTAIRNDMSTIDTNTGYLYRDLSATSSFLSAAIDNKLDTSSFENISGSFYTNDNPSGFITGVDLSNYYTKNETSGADELANAFSNIPAGDEEVNNAVHTYSGDWNSTYTTVHSNSASWVTEAFTGVDTDSTLTGNGKDTPLGVADTQTLSSNESISITTAATGVILGVNSSWFDNAVNSAVTGTQGDAEVNAAVHNNSATWNTVTNKLDTTAFSTVSGDFYPYSNPSGFITGVDLSNYYTKNETSGASELADAFSNLPTGDEEVNLLVHSNSGVWNDVTGKEDTITFGYSAGAVSSINGSAILGETIPYEVYGISAGDNITIWEDNNALWISAGVEGSTYTGDVQGALNEVYTNSSVWLTAHQDISTKLDTTAFSDVSGTFLTAIPAGYATESYVQTNSAEITAMIPTDYYPNNNPSGFITGVDLSNYYTKSETSGAEELENAFNNIPAGDPDVNSTVQNNSANWNNSYTALTSTSGDWNNVYGTVLANSASWAASELDSYTLSAGNNIQINKDDVNSAIGIAVTGLENYQTTAGMTSYYTKTDTSSKQELSDAIGNVETLLASL